MFLTHELFGHEAAALALGAHVVRVTSVKAYWNGDLSSLESRAISAAGIGENLIFGAIALLVLRRLNIPSAAARFFLWFYGHATIFMGSGYLAAGAIFSFGDVPQTLHGLPFETAWRCIAALAGSGLMFAAWLSASRTLDRWAGNARRGARARAFSLVPYLAMSVAATLSGFAGPDAHFQDVAWSAAATFAANMPFAFLALALPRASASAEPLDLKRSPGWITAGALACALFFFVFAPGVPRTGAPGS